MSLKNRSYVRAEISRKAETGIIGGHPWIYDTEVKSLSGYCENGGLVDVVNGRGRYMGTGYYNSNSKIRIRLISTNANDRFDYDFYERRVRYAWEYRKTVMGSELNCCRVIFGEADTFPGLTVDKFNDILVAQVLSLGTEKVKDMIFAALIKVLGEDGFNIKGIYERNDVNIRNLEGMEQYKGFYPVSGLKEPQVTSTTITENNIKYNVDFENGQKTGFFLDQKFNRLAAAKIAKGRRVLDCFTHTGSFALNAVYGGANHVCAVDISEDAVQMAKNNAQLNGFEDRMSFKTANVFDLLPTLPNGEEKYDYVILDPPAFTKSRSTVDSAMRGYKEINLRAMKLLPRGGYLATCSCSHFMTDELFRTMLKTAAFDAHVELRQIEARQQAPDHPILWNVPETNYLKFYIFQVV